MNYNGWAIRETWLVNVWFNPERVEDVDSAKEYLEEELQLIQNSCLKDMVCLDSVDWQELREAMTDE